MSAALYDCLAIVRISSTRAEIACNSVAMFCHPFLNRTACGSDRHFREPLSQVRHGAANSRFKKLLVIVMMEVKLMKSSLSRIGRLQFRENRQRASSDLYVGVDG